MRRKRRETPETKPDMTPFSDMTFQLLVFFLVTLKFRTLEGRLDAALPKDMGTQTFETEPIEKVDILLWVTDPGSKQKDSFFKGKDRWVGRSLRYDVGSQRFTRLEDLERFLSPMDKEETPITLDARKGTINEDVVKVLDVVIGLGFRKVSFAGSHEEE
ncbi:MAG: biopolymer transporter ExbD [Planctomycetota bacterium]|nr:MAG: biopolymer transporter ExbD [Planctomycetota bacterium]